MRYSIDGRRVSRDWWHVLRGAELDGVAFVLNQGRRTLAEQAAFYARYLRDGWPLAAKPTPWAPHVRAGRQDHALDVATLDGGMDRLRAWLHAHGVTTTLTVRGESWHVEANDAAALHRLARRIAQRERRRRVGGEGNGGAPAP